MRSNCAASACPDPAATRGFARRRSEIHGTRARSCAANSHIFVARRNHRVANQPSCVRDIAPTGRTRDAVSCTRACAARTVISQMSASRVSDCQPLSQTTYHTRASHAPCSSSTQIGSAPTHDRQAQMRQACKRVARSRKDDPLPPSR